jgi:hypothetical protein
MVNNMTDLTAHDAAPAWQLQEITHLKQLFALHPHHRNAGTGRLNGKGIRPKTNQTSQINLQKQRSLARQSPRTFCNGEQYD